ncbi:MAG: DNA translocase FtsK [bacterium]|nr:DNA translocase FtsK [bacterium]
MARGRRAGFKIKLKKQTVYSIVSIGLVAGAVLALISLFYPRGGALLKISTVIDAYFGWTAYALPVILLLLAALISQIKAGFAKMNFIAGVTIMWLCLAGLSSAGTIGTGLWQNLEIIFPVGFIVFIILVFVLLFGASIAFNISIGEWINNIVAFLGHFIKALRNFFTFNFSFKKKEPIFIKDTSPKPVPVQISPMVKPIENKLVEHPAQNENGEGIKLWEYPPLDLLSDAAIGQADRGDPNHYANVIEKTLDSFGITAKVAEVNKGPAVTQYALEIAQGTKIAKITSLQNDLALALAAPNGMIRIEAPISGRSLVGIEIPNRTPEFVPIRRIMESEIMQNAKSKLTVALGLDVSGRPIVADIGKMPHVLVAGATGSGKSICINAFITSLLFRNSPSELKLIMIDPKRVELTLYNGIPHLLTPVIVDLEKILSALKWALSEMDRRYKLFAANGVRNIDSYNELSGFQALPYIVIFIDELAEIMLFAPVEVEDSICRIAQLARATGIHLVVSTQRPSVDVITGLIKANISCRIAFNVTSMVDSRVIIDTPGAEKLLGRGDMLYIPPDQPKPLRIQGAFVSEKEANDLVNFLKSKGGPAQYTEEVTAMPILTKGNPAAGGGDPLTDQAIRLVCQFDKASASLLQRKLSVGYARAARILDQLQDMNIVGPAEGSKPRDVLIRNADEYFQTASKQE